MEKGGDGDGVSHSGDDPEVTAITRRLDRTGDTLGAINELEQLLIERTGQIPVISPELLAAHAARIEHSDELRAQAEAAASAAEPDVAHAAEDQASLVIDWSIVAPVPLDPAPGFSPWVDPEAIAAAIDTTPPEFTDVSTKVFAVFSADRAEPEAPAPEAPQAAPAPESEPEPETQAAPAPLDAEELDGIDDRAPEALHEPIAAPAEKAAEPEPVAAEAPAHKRRLWPFGRR